MTALEPILEAQARAALMQYGLGDARLRVLGGGLINVSLRVDAPDGRRWVLQRLHAVFDPAVNLNLDCVTRELARTGMPTPLLLRTSAGAPWVTIDDRHWRVLSYVEGRSVDAISEPALAREAGRLLASFHRALADFREPLPLQRPTVHEPHRHFAALRAARTRHADHRHAAAVGELAAEIDALFAGLPDLPGAPLRLVHGDPKISNLLFDGAGHGLCLVDLDTLARAPLCFELGDAFRSWCNPGPEDAAAPVFSGELFLAALEGYASVARDFMTPAERASVVPATAAVYLELTVRFAADALEERYFGWDPARYATRGDHNLARARNQLAAARDLLRQHAPLARAAERLLAAGDADPAA